MLDHPNGWHRDTASRLIFESARKVDRKFEMTLLHDFYKSAKTAWGKIHALRLLDSLSVLQPEEILSGIRDTRAPVRIHALRVAEDHFANQNQEKNWSNTPRPSRGIQTIPSATSSRFPPHFFQRPAPHLYWNLCSPTILRMSGFRQPPFCHPIIARANCLFGFCRISQARLASPIFHVSWPPSPPVRVLPKSLKPLLWHLRNNSRQFPPSPFANHCSPKCPWKMRELLREAQR